MNQSTWFVAASAASLWLAQGCCTAPCGKPVATASVAAQKTIDLYAGGGSVLEREVTRKHGEVFYEADVSAADGSMLKLLVDVNGKLYKLERKECKHEPKGQKPE